MEATRETMIQRNLTHPDIRRALHEGRKGKFYIPHDVYTNNPHLIMNIFREVLPIRLTYVPGFLPTDSLFFGYQWEVVGYCMDFRSCGFEPELYKLTFDTQGRFNLSWEPLCSGEVSEEKKEDN